MEQRLKDISLHLLDLGKRNRLINYKQTGYRSIEIHNEAMDTIFDKVTSGIVLSIFSLDSVLQKYQKTIDATGDSVEEYSIGKVRDITKNLLRPNDLLCYKKGISLNKVLKILLREYKNTLLEKGINTLYMTFCMVEYSEKNESYLAPLLLIPIDLSYEQGSFKLKEAEDEIILNPTLKYLLKEEYKIDLPDYDEAVYVLQEYLSLVSSTLSEQGLRLLNTMSIGIYSFLKMNMFNDLRNHANIVLENGNIRNLLGETTTEPIEEDNLPIYPVVDADQSQLEAIDYAVKGRSFVLQGPPGTGKSQTITNMIASLIGNGKKVLFVSEKQAALNVVYENLRRAGLDSFAVELHSHKANKKEFIDELYKTAILPKYDIQHDAEDLSRKYAYLSSILEEYRTKLHQPIKRVSKSMYEIYSSYLKVERTDFLYPIQNIEALSVSTLEQVCSQLDLYAKLSSSLGYDYHKGPFYGFISKDFSYLKFEAKQDLEKLYTFYKELSNLKNAIMKLLPFQLESYKDIIEAIPHLDSLIQLNSFLPEYLNKEKRELLCKRIEIYRKRSSYIASSTLNQFFDLKILKMESLNEFTNAFEELCQKKFKWLSMNYHRAKKDLSIYTKLKMKDKDILLKLKEAIEYKKNLASLQKIKKVLPQDFRSFELDVLYQDAISLKDLPFSLDLTKESYGALKKSLMDIVIQFKRISSFSIQEYMKHFDAEILHLIDGNIDELMLKLKDMVDSIDLLDAHTQRLSILKELEEYQVIPLLDQAIEQRLNMKKLSLIYEASFWQANILYELEHEPIFQQFAGLGIESIVEDFKMLDQTHLEANKAFIISKLSNQRPDESIMLGTKFSVLVKEYNKNRKQKPIRLLLEEIFDLILEIKPVFLMSPLSVSTYLNSELNLFDTVIFDEASQVFAWDALGAIYRARQCIIIGDSKQMPPSSFFSSMIEDEDDYENDMESILDKGSTVFSTKRLNYHYRSKSEELIQFSNQEFYDDRLITIPQAKKHQPGFGIDFHFVMGTYEVKARTNLIEAKYVVDLVFQHAATYPDKSLGVVAFSNTQADLIMDLIEERLDHNPENRAFFTKEGREPFFVKNLESVQGDERDVILFSICFGYTKEHKFYQRFGPLNSVGGERRLNVAITRAKENLCVVSSIRSSDIKLDQTESVGVATLKRYLEYAEQASYPRKTNPMSTDGVISSIANFLKKNGFIIETNIGTSAFKIDIAVIDKTTQEYQAAIMLDGSSYQIGNCSDANALQERLLSRLGWKFIRVFSTQWVMNEKIEQERILHFLRNQTSLEEQPQMKRDFLVEIEESIEDEFDSYPMISEEQLHKLYNQKSPRAVIEYILSEEGPIHIDYLLKRICFMYGRTKVTTLVKEYFEKDLEEMRIYRDKDFLSLSPITEIPLRIPSSRSIEQIHPLELKDGIYKIVRKSNGITKEGCFKKLISLLGYNRMSERAIERLEEALIYLKLDGQIIEKQDCLYS